MVASIQTRTPDCVKLVKVKAHTDPKSITDPYLRWMVDGNNCADAEAKSSVVEHRSYPKLAKQYTVYTGIEKDITSYHTYICEHSQAFFQMEKQYKAERKDQISNQQGYAGF